MRVLVVTAMLPTRDNPARGIFVEEQIRSIRQLGVVVDTFAIEGPAKLKYVLAVPALRRVIHCRAYDLVHAHHAYCGLVAVLASRLPTVVTFHGAEVSGRSASSRALSRFVSRRAAASIVVSSEMQRILRRGRAEVIPCGVDRSLFRPRNRDECRLVLGLPTEPKLVLFTGLFDGKPRPVKRVDLAQEAVFRARRQIQSIQLWVVSKVPHDQMPTYIGASDAVILTSDAEGSPMIVKEALASGVPVVSVPVGDVPEIARLTQVCFLSDRDPDALADKLVKACRLENRQRGSAWLEEFSLESVARRLVKIYSRVASRRESAA